MSATDRRLISSGSSFEALAGYSRAVVDGEWVFMSGTTGFDYATGTIADDVAAQTEQTLRNIQHWLTQAGANLADIVQLRVYLAAAGDFAVIAPIFGAWFKDIRPTNTTIVTGFVDPRMKIEIEATARRRGIA